MRVWLVNNYATPPSLGGLVRHYYFSKYFQQEGHSFRILTSSQIHNTTKNFIEDSSLYRVCDVDGVEYTFVRSMSYTKNNWRRIVNMLDFPLHCVRTMKALYQAGERPDVIYASSPMPLAGAAAFRWAKKHDIPVVFEVRDLWPKSIVDYSRLTDRNVVIRALYRLEHSLYRRADRVIFTMAGGQAYLEDRGWAEEVPAEHIVHINNGVDLQEFTHDAATFVYDDPDLEDAATFKIVYTGSIRHIYEFGTIVETAALCRDTLPQVRFLIYGEGTERLEMQERAQRLGLTNLQFKGRVEKKYIPSILQRADLALLHHRQVDLARYGLSPNKLFEYLAAGCPVLCTVQSRYSLLRERKCGVESPSQSPDDITATIADFCARSESERQAMRRNAAEVAEEHDYSRLAKKLENCFLSLLEEKRGEVHA